MGKSTHMFSSANQDKSQGIMMLRFLGTTPDSSSVKRLLKSLTIQILQAYSKKEKLSEIPNEFSKLIEFFAETLKVATPKKPLVIYLDSLDQLTSENDAHKILESWLTASRRKITSEQKAKVSEVLEMCSLPLFITFIGHF